MRAPVYPRRLELLADRLTLVLVESGPASGSDLALLVGARKQAVLRVLRTGPQFERVGAGRMCVWRLTGTGREPQHGDVSHGRGQDIAAAFAAHEARLAALEARLGVERETVGPAPLAGQITVDEALAQTNGAGAP